MEVKGIALALVLSAGLFAAEGPDIESQPVPCTVSDKPLTLCARVTSEGDVTAARIYFRREGAEFFNFVDMAFGGINYCGTLPPPKDKARVIEYYIEAIDDKYESKRLSTFQMEVKAEGSCEFPPVEKDPAKYSSITVHATNKKQGRKLDEVFDTTRVTFIPIASK